MSERGRARIRRGPAIAWWRLGAQLTIDQASIGSCQEPGHANEEQQAKKRGRAQWAAEWAAQVSRDKRFALFGLKRRGITAKAAEHTADSVQAKAQRLPVPQATGKHIEQDTEIQCPGNERTVGRVVVHGSDFSTERTQVEVHHQGGIGCDIPPQPAALAAA